MVSAQADAKSKKMIGIGILSIYIFGRMAAEPIIWSHISVYYSYLFEILIVTFAVLKLHKPNLNFIINKKMILFFCMLILAGFITHFTAKWGQIMVPFNFNSLETICLLLFLAPVLEEAIFRLALWDAIKQLTQKKYILISLTSLFFMMSHFISYWYVPEEYKSFIIYQAAYVIPLGISTGLARVSTQSITAPILIHFAFNLGFLLFGLSGL
jgi:membrane protease YdiL (CAAX protease family)